MFNRRRIIRPPLTQSGSKEIDVDKIIKNHKNDYDTIREIVEEHEMSIKQINYSNENINKKTFTNKVRNKKYKNKI